MMDASGELWALANCLFCAAEQQDDGTYLVRIGESGMAAIAKFAFPAEVEEAQDAK